MTINKIISAPTSNEQTDKINELVDGVNNAGTVKKVNNTSPDSNGNVSLTIPTVNNGKTIFKKDGTAIATITANQTGTVNVDYTIPSAITETTVSGWGFTKNVGTVTSVNNISPVNGNVTLSIPTVNDGKIIYQKNGTSFATASVNQTSTVTVNYTIPTQASDINAQSTLVSGTNIKTINGNSLLGSGDISISAGATVTYDSVTQSLTIA